MRDEGRGSGRGRRRAGTFGHVIVGAGMRRAMVGRRGGKIGKGVTSRKGMARGGSNGGGVGERCDRDLRLRDRRRRHGGLRAGQPALGRSEVTRAAAGGGRQGQLDLDPHPDRLSLHPEQPAHRLVLSDRTRARPERAGAQLSARPRARRLLLDQRHDLHARPGARLRRLAPGRATAAGAGTTSCRTSRNPRTMSAGADEMHGARRRVADRAAAPVLGDPGRLPRRRGRGRHPENHGLQPRQQRGLRLLPGQPAPRRALEHRQGVSAPGARAGRTSPC